MRIPLLFLLLIPLAIGMSLLLVILYRERRKLLREIQSRKKAVAQVTPPQNQDTEWYRAILYSAPDGMLVVDGRGIITLTNAQLEEMFGYAEGELIGRPVEVLIPPALRASHVKKREGFTASGKDARLLSGTLNHLFGCRKDGSEFPVDVSLARLPDRDGHVGATCAAVRDITGRRRMEEALLQREQEFRTLAENSPDPISRYDRDCRRLYVNAAITRSTGKSAEELIGRTPADGAILVSEENKKLMEGIRCVFERNETVTLELELFLDGCHRDHQVLLVPEHDSDGQVTSVLNLVRDITSVRDAERRMSHFVSNLPGFVYTFRMTPEGHGSFPFVSRGIEDLYGLRPEDVKEDMAPLHALAHPEDRPRIEAALAESARTMTQLLIEVRVCPPGRPERWIECRALPEWQADRSMLWHGIMLDITERKQTEKNLKLMDFSLNNVQEEVFLSNEESQILYANDAACRILGYSREELLGMRVVDIDPDFSQEQWRIHWLDLKTHCFLRFEGWHKAKNGSSHPVEITANYFEYNGQGYNLGITRDITKRKRAEQDLKLRDFALNSVQEEVLLLREDGSIAYANESSCRALGYSLEEHLNLSIFDIDPNIPLAQWPVHWLELNTHCSTIIESQHVRKNGTSYPVEVTISDFEFDGIDYGLGLAHDITERKAAERVLARTTRALKTLSACNEALVHATSETEIFHSICKSIVEIGGYSMAWVGLAEQDQAKTVRPLAHYGREEGFLEEANITWAETERGRGPGGTAIRTGTVQINKSFLTNPVMAPWREAARQRGYQSNITLPLKSSTGRVHVLGIYASETDVFNEDEVQLLQELAADLAYGIESLHAHTVLAENEELLRLEIERMPLGHISWDTDFRMVAWNPEAEKIFGYTAAEALGCKFDLIVPKEAYQHVATLFHRLNAGEESAHSVNKNITKDGREILCEWTNTPLKRTDGAVLGITSVVSDVTALKVAERHYQEHLQFLENMDRINRAIQGTGDLDQMLNDVLNETLSIFHCDRAWLVYPLDPKAPTWNAVVEITVPEYPGAFSNRNLDIPMDDEVAKGFQLLLETDGPCLFGPQYAHAVPSGSATQFQVKTFIAMALYPKGDKPFMFGLHQCSSERTWTTHEVSLFQEIGRRLADDLTSHLITRELRKSKAALNRAQTITHIGSWQHDISRNTWSWSEETANIFGIPRGTPITLEALANKIHPEDRERCLKEWEDALQGAPYNSERRLIVDDQIKWAQGRAEVILDDSGKAKELIGTVQDITERKQIEENLNQALLLAQKANAAKSEFLANISHEIRTPMNGVIGVVGMLKETDLNGEQQSYVHMIERSGSWLLSLVNDLLDLSKIEDGKIELSISPFNLKQLLEDIAVIFELRATEKGVLFSYSLEPDVPLDLLGDESLLRQIIGNLAGNAVKFTEKGAISLLVQREESRDPESILLRFSIQDSGIGIPADQQEKIFEVFTQIDSSASRKHKGTGLGLAIAKKLVTLMGGEIGVISKPGKGSEFWFTARFGRMEAGSRKLEAGEETSEPTLPSSPQLPTPSFRLPASILPTSAERAAFRILLAEDNITNQRVALFLLKKLGFLQTDAVVNGLEVLQALREKEYDLVLMDVQMPEMDGFEATRQIRDPQSDVRRHDLPILAITAHALTGYEEKCLESGMNGYLAKPINLSALGEALNTWVRRKTKT